MTDDETTETRVLLVGSTGLKAAASRWLASQPGIDASTWPTVDPAPITFTPAQIEFEVKAFEALGKLLYPELDTTSPINYDEDMTTYHTISLTTEQAQTVLDLIDSERSCGADPDFDTYDAIEREIDSALLRHEQEISDAAEGPLASLLSPEASQALAAHARSYDEPNTCEWLMEDRYREDGTGIHQCGGTVEAGEQRALCPWHASAMDLSDEEFEGRVEAGETWS